MKIEDEHLGDGVYAAFDGEYIILDLRGQDNTTRICLDSGVINALLEYHKRIITKLETPTHR